MAGLDEFDFIKSRLKPLSQGGAGAADLSDDGAVLALGPGERLAVTADALVEGRHFPVGEAPDLAARKALRANLSDLAAMGARPFAYTSSVIWPTSGFQERAEGFVAGLAADQKAFGVRLIGGDTVVADAPWSIAITAFGRVPAGISLRRANARPGDLLVVTGTIGDAGLGLKMAGGDWRPKAADQAAYLSRRFQLPEPRISAGLAARSLAHAAIDISDGLLSEARHLAIESGLCATLDLDRMPVSEAAAQWLGQHPENTRGRLELASSGDDYELLFAAPPDRVGALVKACGHAGVKAVIVGALTVREEADPVQVMLGGQAVRPDRFGFTQF
jgi:thiamine-monophosphate kinase